MFLALVLTVSLQQAPLAQPLEPSIRLLELDRELTTAPRGWPRAGIITMASSLMGAVLFGVIAPFVAPLVLSSFFIAAVVIATFASAGGGVITAATALIASAVEAWDRRQHILSLEAERARLSGL